MRKKILNNAKLVVTVESNKGENLINTISVFDNRTQKFWNDFEILERNIKSFLNKQDLEETLNWNLNGDDSKFQFKWGLSGKNKSQGIAYVFN